MGTTLTGTTPQDTYDSLIKVTDNGPLSGTAKYLSDGLGNDSVLALSTTAVGIGTNSLFGKFNLADGSNARLESTPVADGVAFEVLDSTRTNPLDFKIFANDILFNTKVSGSYTERMRIDSAGNVGIGTSSPASPLSVGATAVHNLPASTANFSTADAGKFQLRLTSTSFNVDGNWVGLGMGYSENYMKTAIIARALDGAGRGTINFCLNTSSTSTNVSLADTRVTVTSNGLTFNGDTAAANALDDYEEGTWTPVYAGGITGATYSNTVGKYTKIGNAVHWACRIQATAGTAAATALTIGGFPFTNSATVETAGSIGFFTVYTTDSVYMYNEPSTTSIAVFYNIDGTALAGTELTSVTGTIHCSGTYFV